MRIGRAPASISEVSGGTSSVFSNRRDPLASRLLENTDFGQNSREISRDLFRKANHAECRFVSKIPTRFEQRISTKNRERTAWQPGLAGELTMLPQTR